MKILNDSKILLIVALLSAAASVTPSLAWDGHYWDYHGSGRDHAYSQYIDLYYSPEYVSLSSYDPSTASFISYINYPRPVMLTPASNPYASQVPILPTDQFTVNIPNRSGGYTAVLIKRSGNGYVGPQGEYYTVFPTVALLEIIYGKK